MNYAKAILRHIAYARSGDKGSNSNIGIIAYTEQGYQFLKDYLTSERMSDFFKALPLKKVERYELPNLLALNFLLYGALDGGASRSLRIDSQGKVLGQAALEMEIEIPIAIFPKCIKSVFI